MCAACQDEPGAAAFRIMSFVLQVMEDGAGGAAVEDYERVGDAARDSYLEGGPAEGWRWGGGITFFLFAGSLGLAFFEAMRDKRSFYMQSLESAERGIESGIR
ncbi:hypothetical protein VTL71DRAFT_8778 [Oculimacula yallundae]|uniref:Uncharacterized protein n=1 Tax=Oculimacula yallundae TaxID=86028 RepID=A0ABR4CYS4_9HELO